MTEHAPGRIWSGIDIPKTIAGVLAAVSAAVLGSYLGVAGTLAGAAVASVVGSVGTEVYHRWIDHGSKKIRSTFVTVPAAVGTPPVAATTEAPAGPIARTRLRWGHIAAVAGAVFVLAVGVLTAYELITRQSIADAVGNDSTRGTTVGSVLGGAPESGDSRPAPTPSGSTPATGEATPAETGETPPPSTAPTTAPAAPQPTTEPTAEPAGTAATAPPQPAETGAPTDEE